MRHPTNRSMYQIFQCDSKRQSVGFDGAVYERPTILKRLGGLSGFSIWQKRLSTPLLLFALSLFLILRRIQILLSVRA